MHATNRLILEFYSKIQEQTNTYIIHSHSTTGCFKGNQKHKNTIDICVMVVTSTNITSCIRKEYKPDSVDNLLPGIQIHISNKMTAKLI